jgi:hypothetical protein
MNSVQPRQCLHRLYARQPFIDIHRMKKWLIESRLIFLRDKEDLIFSGRKFLRQLFLADTTVHLFFRVRLVRNLVVGYDARKSDQ